MTEDVLEKTLSDVALLVSAWIEILQNMVNAESLSGRTPRECVD